MQAIMVKDDYTDITLDFPYEIEKVYQDNTIKLKNNPGRYKVNSFNVIHNGKKIPYYDVYRQYKLQVLKNKLGIK